MSESATSWSDVVFFACAMFFMMAYLLALVLGPQIIAVWAASKGLYPAKDEDDKAAPEWETKDDAAP